MPARGLSTRQVGDVAEQPANRCAHHMQDTKRRRSQHRIHDVLTSAAGCHRPFAISSPNGSAVRMSDRPVAVGQARGVMIAWEQLLSTINGMRR